MNSSLEKKPAFYIDENKKHICKTCKNIITNNPCKCTPIKYRIHLHRTRLRELVYKEKTKMSKNTLDKFEKEIGDSIDNFQKKFPEELVCSNGEKWIYGKDYSIDHIIPLSAKGFNIIENEIHRLFLMNIQNLIPMKKEKNSKKGNTVNQNEVNFILEILNNINSDQINDSYKILSDYRIFINNKNQHNFRFKINHYEYIVNKENFVSQENEFKTDEYDSDSISIDSKCRIDYSYIETKEEHVETEEEHIETKEEQVETDKEEQVETDKELEEEIKKLEKELNQLREKKKNREWDKIKNKIYQKEFNYEKMKLNKLLKNNYSSLLIKIPNSWEEVIDWEENYGNKLKQKYFDSKIKK
jgi:hypothetical protein